MAYLQFVTDLFLEVTEMTRFKESLDDNGFRKELLENSVSFGLIKSAFDPTFVNGLVQRDLDNVLGQKTIKVNALNAIDSSGLFIVNNAEGNIVVPADGNWYWVRVSHLYTTTEKGTVSIDATGNLVGVGTEFTKILRGNPNYPSRVKLLGSSSNTLEYDVLSVVDDTHAILVHPAVTVGGNAAFTSESGLQFAIVGTFTPKVAVPQDNKYPFRYDSCLLELVIEVTPNVKPNYTVGQQFYLARVQVSNGQLVIQDKRLEYWETKASYDNISIEREDNPLIGVEAVKWENVFNTGDKNVVQIAWGMRSANWTIDSSQNIVTLLGSATGGSFKDPTNFTNGDFNGWRLYTSNGKYRKVVTSIKQGGAINLFLDVLDVDDFSNDGGVTFITQTVLCAPDSEEVQIQFTANQSDDISNVNETYTFPINTPVADCLATVYKDPSCLYNVQYRYKSFKEYTTWLPINSGSYYTEASFQANGDIVVPDARITYSYTSDPTVGFILLFLSANSYIKFASKVYKGDIIGVNTITAFAAGQVLELVVGTDKRYQHITGTIALTDDIFISLSRSGAVEGNEFRLHFDCTSLNIGDNHIYIADNYSGGSLVLVKTLVQGDAYEMQNMDGGIVIDCVFDNTGKWIAYQNYDLGQSNEVKMFDGDVNVAFDGGTKQGKIKGYFGWQLHTILNSGRVAVGAGHIDEPSGGYDYPMGTSGGEVMHKLIVSEMPSKKITLYEDVKGGASGINVLSSSATSIGHGQLDISVGGTDTPHNNMQPYYVLAFVKKMY